MKQAAFEVDMDRLWVDIDHYLQFVALTQEEDAFWKEYSAWKRLTEKRAKLVEPTGA